MQFYVNSLAMSDILVTLVQKAIYQRAAIMEQWLSQHAYHEPGPSIELPQDDITTCVARCACGESFEASVIISTAVRRQRAKIA